MGSPPENPPWLAYPPVTSGNVLWRNCQVRSGENHGTLGIGCALALQRRADFTVATGTFGTDLASLTVSSLNTISAVLREAEPLFAECRLILNYLDEKGTADSLPRTDDAALEDNPGRSNNDACSISHTVVELRRAQCNRRDVM